MITRFPYNTRVSDEELRQVEKAERFLMDEGFSQVRVRKYGDIARIEVDPAMIGTLVESKFVNKIVPYVKSLGFEYVTVDMVGYKTGSMDFEILNNTTAAK